VKVGRALVPLGELELRVSTLEVKRYVVVRVCIQFTAPVYLVLITSIPIPSGNLVYF